MRFRLPVIKLFVPFIIVFAVGWVLFWRVGTGTILDVWTWPAVRETSQADGDFLCAPLVFCTALLILINSGIYAVVVYDTAEEARTAEGRSYRKRSFLVVLGMLVVNFAWLIDFWSSVLPGFSHKPELIALSMFAVFAYVDRQFAMSFRREVNSGEAVSGVFQRRHQYYMRQALFVDLPVVVGVGAVLLFTILVERAHPDLRLFTRGFLAGALVMHLASSQFIFLIVSVQDTLAAPPRTDPPPHRWIP